MDEELKEQVLELLANSLTIDIDTKSEYVGGMDDNVVDSEGKRTLFSVQAKKTTEE